MATCKDCLHEKACFGMLEAMGYKVSTDYKGAADRCDTYTPKSRYAEVKHGEWIVEEFPAEVGTKKVSCSNCGRFEYKGKSWDVKEDALPFCSNCGADMQGGCNNG